MLIIFDKEVVNLNRTTVFFVCSCCIAFYSSFSDRHKNKGDWLYEFKNEETAKKAFDRIVYAYANEYRTLDLSEYATLE